MVLWVFGYASLVWKAGFDYDERIVGFIKGYRRAFHLACFEHRGTLDLPARVATLEQDDEAVCWGVAYCIKGAEAAQRAMSYLHVRECEYDVIKSFEFFTEDSPDKPVISKVKVFMSTLNKQSNKYYLGAASKEDIAKQIATATGPCGPNCDYLFRLVEGLREIGHEDAEVVELANAVRRTISEQKAQANMKITRQSSLFSSHSFGPNPHLISTSVQGASLGASLSQSPRLLKSQAS